MKVLIITYYWPPAGGPGVQRWLKFCKYLPQNGIDPIVITVKENEATWPIRDSNLVDQISDQLEDAQDEHPLLPLPAPSRRRLRSRNAFIDSELGGGGYGADSYADLEDFIVVKKGRRY